MRTVIIISCLIGVALCVPVVVHKDQKPIAELPGPVQAEPLIEEEVARKRRHLIDVDIYNGGFGDGFGYGGGFGGYPGYGGFGGYPGYGYGGFGGYPGFGGYGGYGGYGGFF